MKYFLSLKETATTWDTWTLTSAQRSGLLLLGENEYDESLLQDRQQPGQARHSVAANLLTKLFQNETNLMEVPEMTKEDYEELADILFRYWTIAREVNVFLVLEPHPQPIDAH